MVASDSNSSPNNVKKFYFLDYFWILLQALDQASTIGAAFPHFKRLKDKERLGESKYRKLSSRSENEGEVSDRRYTYTYRQVLTEAREYDLFFEVDSRVQLTQLGQELLAVGRLNRREFYERLFRCMEERFRAFRHLVELCYKRNPTNQGLLIFPKYSPAELGFLKGDFVSIQEWERFLDVLKNSLENDISRYLSRHISLSTHAMALKNQVRDYADSEGGTASSDYNKINAVIRNFWRNFFLKEVYRYPYSFETFNIWVERGKQMGVFYSTDFYPGFMGRLVFPTSVLLENTSNSDFFRIHKYEDKGLLVHKPRWEVEENQNKFIEALTAAYFGISRERKYHLYFLRLPDVREVVCYKLRIPAYVFNSFLEKAYQLSLRGETTLRISLEADRLPQETGAMYIKREPVEISGKFKNIIAIDYRT